MEIKLFEFGEFTFSNLDDLEGQVKGEREGNEKERVANSITLFGFNSSRGQNGNATRRLDFDSELCRMSAIAKTHSPAIFSARNRDHHYQSDNGTYYVYSKGSPESMVNIVSKDSVPQNYQEVVREYASQGLRVLAIGHRLIKSREVNLSRVEVEQGLVFDGFEVFENRLKP